MGLSIQSKLQFLNENQREVVYSDSRRLLCLAGAGTGKTYTMIMRILYLVEELNIDPSSILCLTFTHAAAAEMESRYRRNCKFGQIPYFGTFHAFCYWLLGSDKEVLKAVGYKTVPQIIDNEEEEILQATSQMLISVKLPKYKRKITYKPKTTEKFQWEVYQKKFDQLLRKENKITFDRLCYRVCELFEIGHPSVTKYIERFNYIMVDEFQDTDPLQWKFVKSFEDSHIMLVGDVRQAIYQFRGADSSIIKSISIDSDWSVVKLEENYRSTIQICQYANNIIDSYQDDIPDIALSSTKSGPEVAKSTMTEFIHKLPFVLNNSGTTAILARTNKEVDSLKLLCMRRNVPFITKKDSSAEKELLAAINEDFRSTYLLSLLNVEDKSEILRKLYLDSSYDIDSVFKKKLPEYCDRIKNIQNSEDFSEISKLIASGQLTVTDVAASKYARIQEENVVYIGTIHSVKGLEFDNVYLIINSEYGFDFSKEEHKNLYYVGCTRPKTNLTIVHS